MSIISTESNSTLSPTDGYFRRSSLPSRVFEEAAPAGIMGESKSGPSPQGSAQQAPPYPQSEEPRSSELFQRDDATPLLYQRYRDFEDTPPAYDAVPEGLYPNLHGRTTSYGSQREFPDPALQHAEQHSPSTSAILNDQSRPYSGGPSRVQQRGYIRPRRGNPASYCRRLILVVLCIFIVISLLDAFVPVSHGWSEVRHSLMLLSCRY